MVPMERVVVVSGILAVLPHTEATQKFIYIVNSIQICGICVQNLESFEHEIYDPTESRIVVQ